ncbi:MAG: molybdopterin-dependent oxidoreductase [Candidatus Dormibacteraeota bacterium]|nr:molybdopterin-dependent oxidoreductase [Candidatus Dormibacteraeota bacterium]
MGERLTVLGGCAHDCPDTCSWVVSVENGRAVKLAGNPDHPFTRGGLCAKVDRYLDRVYSPDRVLHPLRRTGPKGSARFERVSWPAALDEIAAKLHEVVAEHGSEAVLPYFFAGNMGLIQYRGMDRRFFARLGASRLLPSICGSTANAGVAATNGSGQGILPEQIVHSRLILLWGTNTIVTNLHLWPFVREARKRGAMVVAIDPIRTRTAAAADWHVRPRPGSDAALALGMMHVILAESLEDRDYIAEHAVGGEELRERVREYPPARVAELTGVPAADIERLARMYATTRPAVIRTLVGPEKHPAGGMLFRTLACLPVVTGAWRDLGGGMLGWTRELYDTAFNHAGVSRVDMAPRRTRVINMVELGRALTDPELAPPVKALFVYDANPAVIAPNQNLVLRGLEREDLFTVVHDLFLTDTAHYADYVLPAASFIEQSDLIWAWGHEYLTLNRPAIEPQGESVSNTELFRRLAVAMGFDEAEFRATDEDLIRTALATDHPLAEGITYEGLQASGYARLRLPTDWRPYADGGFPTASGRAELLSSVMAAKDLDPLPGYEAPVADELHPLTLVSAKSALHFLNSSYSGLPRHVAAEKQPAVYLSIRDAAARGISEGDRVRVFNERGALDVRAEVGDVAMDGVAAMAHGWGRGSGGSANALTSDGVADLGGGADMYSTRVQVERLPDPAG